MPSKYTLRSALNLTPMELSDLTRGELSKVVTTMSSAINKRLKRAEEQGLQEYSLAFRELKTRQLNRGQGAKFTVKGKSKETLLTDYISLKAFFNTEGASLADMKKARETYKKHASAIESRGTGYLDPVWYAMDLLRDKVRLLSLSTDEVVDDLIFYRLLEPDKANVSKIAARASAQLDARYQMEVAGVEI